jgi:uncharacterized protein YkwD
MIKFMLLSLGMMFVASMPRAEGVNADEILAAHNQWRAQVGVGKLSYSSALAESAQVWANTLKYSN